MRHGYGNDPEFPDLSPLALEHSVTDWIKVGVMADFDEDDVFGADANGTPVAVYRVDGEVFATHDICTHGRARLSEGYLEDGLIECPLHQGLFDVKTGAPAGAPCTEAVKAFPVMIEGEEIMVMIAAKPQ